MQKYTILETIGVFLEPVIFMFLTQKPTLLCSFYNALLERLSGVCWKASLLEAIEKVSVTSWDLIV